MRCFVPLVACVVLTGMAWPGQARAQLAQEFQGVRSYALGGAQHGVGTSNDTLYTNPAGMALSRRYSIDMQYGYSPFDALTHVNMSAVDSKTGPVAGAIGYTHDRGDDDGVDAGLHRFYMGAAYALAQSLAFGFTSRHVRGEYTRQDGTRQSLRAYTGDIGAMLMLADSLALGFTYHNVVRTKAPDVLPPAMGLGAAFMMGTFTLAGTIDMDVRHDNQRTYRAGAEVLLGDSFPVRLGYTRAPYINGLGAPKDENLLSGGIGWVSPGGALDIAYRRSVERSSNYGFVAAFKFFL